MTWIVSTEVINPFGIRLGELNAEDYKPYVRTSTSNYRDMIEFETYHGTNIGGRQRYTYWIRIVLESIIRDYIRQVYNLPSDTEIEQYLSTDWVAIYHDDSNDGGASLRAIQEQTFETEAEALEFVDTLGNPEPLMVMSNNFTLVEASFRQEIDGETINRSIKLTYTGDDINLYTITDLINFLAVFFEVPQSRVLSAIEYENNSRPIITGSPYIKAIVINTDGPASNIEVDIDFDGSSIPSDVTVTVVDGDPIVSTTMLENGDGTITISDNGNINMRNDGGTFFLNEFGNVGFYANGDASLTANTQVQLGVGGTTITIENDCFTFRDSTGNVEYTADELSRLKNLLS